MDNRQKFILFVLCSIVGGCGDSMKSMPSGEACAYDETCSAGSVCLSSVCVDTSQNIVVEVKTKLIAQDVLIPQLGIQQNIIIDESPSIAGEVVQMLDGREILNASKQYLNGYTISAVGRSSVLPSLARRFSIQVEDGNRGVFQMLIGHGRYRLSLQPSDPTIPIATLANETLVAGDQRLNGIVFKLSAFDQIKKLSGRLFKRKLPGTRSSGQYITDVEMQVQAFNPSTMLSLSQVAPIDSGQGAFTLYLSPEVAELDRILLVVGPRDEQYSAPTKEFMLEAPFDSLVTLEMGDYGEMQKNVEGTVKAASGSPVPGALVYLDGFVNGGGKFRTKPALTDSNGVFTIDAFPSNAEYQLVVQTQRQRQMAPVTEEYAPSSFVSKVRILSAPNANKRLIEPHQFTAPNRVLVRGTVVSQQNEPVRAARITATPLDDFRTDSANAVITTSDERGEFRLYLEERTHRIEILPASNLPFKSVVIQNGDLALVDDNHLDLGTIPLSNGKQIAGQVLVRGIRPSEYTTLSFYRVPQRSNEEPILIGTTVTDEKGNFRVVVPTK